MVIINGARQVGKSTLAELVLRQASGGVARFLDDPVTRAAAAEDPVRFLRQDGLMLIDEVQRVPDLPPGTTCASATSAWSRTPWTAVAPVPLSTDHMTAGEGDVGTAAITARRRTLCGIVIIVLGLLSTACGSDPAPAAAGGSGDPAPPAQAGGSGASGGLDANGCVVGYDGSRDLFPTKATFRHAGVLVHCGTAAPALSGELAGATVIEVPVRRASVMTTTVLPYFERFDAVARIVGVSEVKQVNTPIVNRAIESTAIGETGQNEKANLETVTPLGPDMIITVKQGDPAGLDRLRQADPQRAQRLAPRGPLLEDDGRQRPPDPRHDDRQRLAAGGDGDRVLRAGGLYRRRRAAPGAPVVIAVLRSRRLARAMAQ